MPLTFIAAKDLCLKVIRLASVGIILSYITKIAHLFTATDNYTKYKIENTQDKSLRIKNGQIFQKFTCTDFFKFRNESFFISYSILIQLQ